MIVVSAQSLRKSYGPIEALGGIDLEIDRGSVLALLGPNGAGKSTLLGCLLGTVVPDSGEVHFNGTLITDTTRARFGYLAERVALYPDRTVWENATFIARLKGVELADAAASLQRTGVSELRDRNVSQLSKGQLQRTGLAIALAGRPEFILLDEPFNGLDPLVLDMFLETIREEQQRGATILLSTHTISIAEEIATDVAILLEGRLAFRSQLDEVRRRFPLTSLELVYRQIARGQLQDPNNRESHDEIASAHDRAERIQ